MHWTLFATVADAAGERELTLDLGEDATVRDALDALFERHPQLRDEVVDDDGNLHDHITLLCGESNPFIDGEGFAESVDEEETLALFPPVSGG